MLGTRWVVPIEAPGSDEILMFACRRSDAKQCCDVTKFDRTMCASGEPEH